MSLRSSSSLRAAAPALSEIEAALAERGQFLGFEPPRPGGDPTLGGVIATGLSGPRRMQAGAARDFVLGVHLMAADGEVLRFGGQVMKNVAGFDVSRLLCGSMGIFGIITELSIKVLPKPARRGNAAVGNAGAPGCGSLQSLGRSAAADFRGGLARGCRVDQAVRRGARGSGRAGGHWR